MNHSELERLFVQIQTELPRAGDIGSGTPVGDMLHCLADAQFVPILPMLRSLLIHTDWNWRLEGARLIGFHFDFTADSDIAQAFRTLLLHDPYPIVRMTAANVLAGRSVWPDSALETALATDPDEDVRQMIFLALLELKGWSQEKLHQAEQHLTQGDLEADLRSFRYILSDETYS